MKVYSVLEDVNGGGQNSLAYGNTKEMLEVLKQVCREHGTNEDYEKFVNGRTNKQIEIETERDDANIEIGIDEIWWRITVVEVGEGF